MVHNIYCGFFTAVSSVYITIVSVSRFLRVFFHICELHLSSDCNFYLHFYRVSFTREDLSSVHY